MSICFAAAVIAVLLRGVTKTVLTKAKLWWDDWLVLFALVGDPYKELVDFEMTLES